MAVFSKPVRAYLIAYAVILLLVLLPQLFYDQDELFLAINTFHTPVLDRIFYWLTYFGDGLGFALLIIALLFYKYRYALLGLIVFLTTSGLAQFLKRVVFSERLRPYGQLSSDHDLYLPEGVEPLFNNSFPSGHTTTAFALAAFLVILTKTKSIWPLWLTLAILAGYSRIYLTHHFPIDVWIGSIIGTAGTFILSWWLNDNFERRFGNKSLKTK